MSIKKILVLLFLCPFLILLLPTAVGPGSPLQGKIVVIDPGHGGYDPGAVRGGVYEKEINLQISLRLKKSLEEKGASVILTRTGDYNLATAGLHSREAHRYDLSKRLEAASRAKAGIFVSIHANCGYGRTYSGAEVFYSQHSENGRLLAENIQKELYLIPDMHRRMAKTSDCYVLRNAKIPAALVEVGYMSNPAERDNLLQEDYQAMLADKIAGGIQKYFNIKTAGTKKPWSNSPG